MYSTSSKRKPKRKPVESLVILLSCQVVSGWEPGERTRRCNSALVAVTPVGYVGPMNDMVDRDGAKRWLALTDADLEAIEETFNSGGKTGTWPGR